MERRHSLQHERSERSADRYLSESQIIWEAQSHLIRNLTVRDASAEFEFIVYLAHLRSLPCSRLRVRAHQSADVAFSPIHPPGSNPHPLDFIECDLIGAPVIKLGSASTGVVGHRGRFLQRTTIL
jgi:hypothetical protein